MEVIPLSDYNCGCFNCDTVHFWTKTISERERDVFITQNKKISSLNISYYKGIPVINFYVLKQILNIEGRNFS